MGIQAQENFLEPFEVQKVRKIGQKQLFFHKNDRIILSKISQKWSLKRHHSRSFGA